MTALSGVIIGCFPLSAFAASEARSSFPQSDTAADAPAPEDAWYEDITSEWGGHFKLRGSASRQGEDTLLEEISSGTYHDGSTEFRLKNRLSFNDRGYLETHYEMIFYGGDTRRGQNRLAERSPDLFRNGFRIGRPVEDDRRLMDLTHILSEKDSSVWYHRLDRLALTLLPRWGTVRIGRQAVTWGNGLIYNPMDLFNPFAPTDVERDYKIGDDMVSIQLPLEASNELQILYVPRRNPSSGDLEDDQSSLAAKYHFALAATEFDLMAARHYSDHVVGIGSTGYWKDAAWRLDATYTLLDDHSDYLSLVANMDYSWVWRRKNFYGMIEFFFNGIGKSNYTRALTDPDLIERIDRGELFTLGRRYLSGTVQCELHPLFNVFLTVINNLDDPSGILQPRAVWDITQDVQILFGGNLLYGGSQTEYGGFDLPDEDFRQQAPNNVYLWVSYFF